MSKIEEITKIVNFFKKYKIENYIINDDFTVDVDSNITIYDQDLINGKIPFQFGKVAGYFDCSSCESLTSLENAPKEVGGYFACRECSNLKSLKGSPEYVGGNFICRYCSLLTSLEGAPEYVGWYFICMGCESLTSLQGAPKYVGGYFYCEDCPNLKSLKGLKEVKGEIQSDFFNGKLKDYKGEL